MLIRAEPGVERTLLEIGLNKSTFFFLLPMSSAGKTNLVHEIWQMDFASFRILDWDGLFKHHPG